MSINFKSTVTLNPKNIMIVDALNLGFRFLHAGDVHFVDEYIKTVDSLARSYKCGKVIIACDQGSSSYRKAIYPEYKQNRKEKQLNQTEEEKEKFELFFAEFLEVLKEIEKKYPVIRYDKCEADDIAAYIVKKFRKQAEHIWLISSDTDWDLLISHNVSRFSYVTRKEVTYDNWSEKYDVPIDSYIDYKCLIGDSGDNVTGVPGVGPKRAAALISEYGSAYDIAANLPIKSNYKYVAALNEFGSANIVRNFKLMDLLTHCEEALGEENWKNLQERMTSYLNV